MKEQQSQLGQDHSMPWGAYMRLGRNWKDLIDVDPPKDTPITEETREQAQKEACRYRGSVRISTGRFYTDQEYKEKREKILNTPLP
jgi:hypothetical protein